MPLTNHTTGHSRPDTTHQTATLQAASKHNHRIRPPSHFRAVCQRQTLSNRRARTHSSMHSRMHVCRGRIMSRSPAARSGARDGRGRSPSPATRARRDWCGHAVPGGGGVCLMCRGVNLCFAELSVAPLEHNLRHALCACVCVCVCVAGGGAQLGDAAHVTARGRGLRVRRGVAATRSS